MGTGSLTPRGPNPSFSLTVPLFFYKNVGYLYRFGNPKGSFGPVLHIRASWCPRDLPHPLQLVLWLSPSLSTLRASGTWPLLRQRASGVIWGVPPGWGHRACPRERPLVWPSGTASCRVRPWLASCHSSGDLRESGQESGLEPGHLPSSQQGALLTTPLLPGRGGTPNDMGHVFTCICTDGGRLFGEPCGVPDPIPMCV